MPDWYEPEDPTPREQCPCCGYISLAERGQFLICTVCWWEDDPFIGDELSLHSGPNHMTLAEGRGNFARFGISDPTMLDRVHPTQRPSFERRPLPTEEELAARRPRTYFVLQAICGVHAWPIALTTGESIMLQGHIPHVRENGSHKVGSMTINVERDQLAIVCDDTATQRGATFSVAAGTWARVITLDHVINVGLFLGWPSVDTFFEPPPSEYDLRR
jgi:hypothetical protein